MENALGQAVGLIGELQ